MTTYNKLFRTKMDELKQREMFLKSDKCTSTDNTKSSQLNKVRRERKTLALIEDLISRLPEDTKLAPLSHDHLINMLTLVSERQSAIHFECKEGDTVLSLLTKYAQMNDLMKRMQKFCDKNELTIDWTKGIVVKANVTKDIIGKKPDNKKAATEESK